PLLKRLWPMLSMIFIGACAGAFWLSMSGSHSMTRALGAALLLYALSGLFLPTLQVAEAAERWLGPLGGFVTGVIASAAALAVGLSWNGALGGTELGASLLALAPALLGMLLGQWLRQRISAVLFKRVFFIGMGLLGLHLLIKG
ncbi:hypothetical protein A234_01005, partial [Pseudomonas syringae pv. actinidiae ICMP 19101]